MFSFIDFKNKIINDKENFDIYNSKDLVKRQICWTRLFKVFELSKKYKRSNSIVLDYGSQNGFLLVALCSYFKHVIGIDIDAYVMSIAKKKLKEEGFSNYKLYRIKPSNKSLLFLKDKSIDLITCTDVLEHVKDLSVVVCLFKRVLKENGYLIVTLPTENFLYNFGNFISYFLGFTKKPHEDGHINNSNYIKNTLKSEFKVVEDKNILFFFKLMVFKNH